MSDFTKKEKYSQDDLYEGYDETIEVEIMSKVKQFFDLHRKLNYYQLNDFLESINLSDVFGSEEDKETIWNIFSKLSSNSNEIDYETCNRGMKELFIFYGLTSEETEEGLIFPKNTEEKENLYEFNSNSNYYNQITQFTTTPYRTTVNNFRESVNSNNKKLDDLLLRISMKTTPDKFPHFNTPYLDSEIPNHRDGNNSTNTNRFNLQNQINQIEGVEKNVIKRTHERKITKMFTEIDINKLQQLRKIFTLLDLRNKENVYLSEIQEVINKYKFIKLSTDELINFLRLISDDIMKTGDNNNQKLSINFELYSRAVSAIEQQLLQVNSDTFTEKNDSYEINDNYNELIEDLNRIEYETVDHIMVLADVIKYSELGVKENLIENYEKLVNKNFSYTENENVIKQNIKEGIRIYENKSKDTQVFLKELNQFCVKKQNKLTTLKLVISKLENNLKNSEEDYRSLFDKFNMNQHIEIDDETERLIEENSYLNEQKRIKEDKIMTLRKEMNEREEQIFYLKNELEKFKTKESENKAAFINLKKEYEILEKNYNFLVNDIYEKIEKEDSNEPTHLKKDFSSNKSSYSSNIKQNKESENFSKLKEKLGKNEDSKKVIEMNYNQLVLYSLNMDSLNKQLEEKNLQKDQRLRELEKQMNEMKKVTSENSKTIYQLKAENVRLQDKIIEMNKEIEINNMFRPSRVLNNRISRISRMNDTRYSNMSSNKSNQIVGNKTGNAGRFEKMKILFEKDANSNNNDGSIIEDKSSFINKPKATEEESQPDVRISRLDIDDIPPDVSYDLKLNSETNSQIQANVNSLNIGNQTTDNLINSNRVTYDNVDISYGNHFTFKNFPTKGQDSINPNRNQISSNIALEVSTFTNRNTGLFSQKDPFSSSDPFLFDEKVLNSSEKEHEINTTPKEKNMRLKYSYRPEDEFYIDRTLNEKLENENNNAITDDLDENPFPSKNEKEEADDEEGGELDNSVNWNKIAKHSPFDVDMIEMKKNREKLKQSITRQNTIEQAQTAMFKNKPTKRLPSLITEEVLEEDYNGDIIGTPSKPEKKSIESNSLKKSISSGSNRMSEEMLRTHTRMNTMDLDTVFNKDSQYVCYDFLTLRKSQGIIKMLEEHSEDVSSYEMFSDNVFLIDENSKKSKKYLFITSNSIYILRPDDLSTKIRIKLKDLNKLTISNKNCNLIAFHFNEGSDLLVEILRRMELLYYFRDLYRMKGFGKLKFKYSDNFKIKRNNGVSNIIVNQANNFFIAPNFENAQKLGYLSKLSGRFFTNFNEKLVVLTNIGLLYFDDPNKPPRRLIPIIGSDIIKIDEKKYKRKYCFEIRTLNGETIVFGAKTEEELDSWVGEFKNFKKNYEKKIKNIEGSSKK